MDQDSAPVRIFVGSSAEALMIARHLQSELEAVCGCEVVRWDSDVFAPSSYSLDALLEVSRSVDFAVLVASADDVTVSREASAPSVRDNIVLEFGLFSGALGRERTYLLATGRQNLKLPTDLLGLTRLPFRARSDGNHRASLNDAALAVDKQIKRLGKVDTVRAVPASGSFSEKSVLEQEVQLLSDNALSQGWQVKKNSTTTLRLCSPGGKTHTLSKTGSRDTREALRAFAKQLRADGLRVNNALRRPVADSPL